ncbi:endonuclease domain-containing protein [Alterisphingorhabdus coralli]|uniref:DUF559 domain-containing protein n=1 Tax=Alterisphingorhabdus coralli TaxID=3071408 RepID=A0AA97F8T2_9SPHN|nr:DUF559 domain-containing protein [Parasphingorhabdus sp. SCSIO 66989]WOE76494.1 DUF559 domain-containing protein [Parasphingorhabdus sp. SCSIO 66989]
MIDRKTLLKRAKEMRNNPTEPEKRLWRNLSNSQLNGHKFRRQAIIENSIVDFLCPSKKLVIEVDGDTHDPANDAKRDAHLATMDYRVVRFTNAEVMQNMDGVLEDIVCVLRESPDRWGLHHPNPSSKEGGR